MRVLFDGFWWHEGPHSNRHVMRSFIQTWCAQYPEDEVWVAVPGQHLAQIDDLPPGVATVTTRLRPHGLAAALEMPLIARRVKADVTVNHNFAPIAGTSAIFVHDVLFQSNPEWFTRAERLYFSFIPLLMPRANRVTTSTRTEAQRIAAQNRRAHSPAAVGLAVDEALRHGTGQRPAGVEDLAGFVLSVGRLNIRKNLHFTITAAIESGVLSASRPLVVVGEKQGKTFDESSAVETAIAEGQVRFLGQVSDDELRWLYLHASLMLFLSLGEGFGLPPVEARIAGCPVVASDLPVFHETLQDWPTFVSPTDRAAAAVAIANAALAPPRNADDVEVLSSQRASWRDCTALLRAELTSLGLG